MKRQKRKNLKMNSKLGSTHKLHLKAKNKNNDRNVEKTDISSIEKTGISVKTTAKEIREQKVERRKLQRENISRPRNSDIKFEDLVRSAHRRNIDYENKINWEEEEKEKFTDRSAKTYYREFKKVVEAADVILQVLDVRDPQGTRCYAMEELVRSYQDKKLVLVLNKADLVPRSNLEDWIKYLKNFYPAISFKCSTQNQSTHIAQISKRALTHADVYQTSKCVGADTLMQLLKNYSRNKGMKTAIVVGVVGMPNVGKSSLINSLKRSKACNVGATPGITKTLQEIILDSKVSLLDCPGVILPGANDSDASSSLRNALRIDDLADLITPIEAILQKAGADNLRKYYDLDSFSTVDGFLAKFARRKNKMSKGGIPNLNAAARHILRDWNVGKISYFTVPPKDVAQGQASLVTSLTKEFDLDDFVSTNDDEMNDDESKNDEENITYLVKPDTILPGNLQVDLPQDEDMQDEPEPEKKPRWETETVEIDFSKIDLKKFQQKLSKKKRKEKNRNVKRTDSLVDAFENL